MQPFQEGGFSRNKKCLPKEALCRRTDGGSLSPQCRCRYFMRPLCSLRGNGAGHRLSSPLQNKEERKQATNIRLGSA